MTSPKLRTASEAAGRKDRRGTANRRFSLKRVTSVRRSTLQRIENGFGDLPDGVGPEKFAVLAANFSEMWSILA